MEAMKEDTTVDPPKEKPKLNREQRRMMERAENEAMETHTKLAKQYFEFFMSCDPEGERLKEIEKEIIAKWKMYCGSRNLTTEARGLMDKYIQAVRTEYKNAKDGTEVQA